MIVWIDALVAAGEYRDGAAQKTRAMRSGVDTARKSGDDDKAGFAEIARETVCEFHAGSRGVTRADDGNERAGEDVALAGDGEERRGIIDHLQARRIVRLAQRDEGDAARAGRLEFALRFLARADVSGQERAATTCHRRQSLERRPGAAVMIDQIAEGARADIVGSDEAQPVEPLLLGQPYAFTHNPPPEYPERSIAQLGMKDNRKCYRGCGLTAQRPKMRSALRADLALAAVQEAGDVGAVHDPQEHREQ
jgi:hypothetical protein